jgi:ureidoglycolate hydrolase
MTIDGKLLEVSQKDDAGYHPLACCESWLVAVLNQGKGNDSLADVTYLEYHAQTDEVFMLLKGEATLLISGGDEKPERISMVKMQPSECYNVKAGVWHGIFLQSGGSVAIVENSDTSRENSEYYYLSEAEKLELIKLDESRENND